MFLGCEQIHSKYTVKYTVKYTGRRHVIVTAATSKLGRDACHEDSDDSGDEREGDEQEVALSEAAILRLMA